MLGLAEAVDEQHEAAEVALRVVGDGRAEVLGVGGQRVVLVLERRGVERHRDGEVVVEGHHVVADQPVDRPGDHGARGVAGDRAPLAGTGQAGGDADAAPGEVGDAAHRGVDAGADAVVHHLHGPRRRAEPDPAQRAEDGARDGLVRALDGARHDVDRLRRDAGRPADLVAIPRGGALRGAGRPGVLVGHDPRLPVLGVHSFSCHRYWPVFEAVSISLPCAAPLPVTSVRM